MEAGFSGVFGEILDLPEWEAHNAQAPLPARKLVSLADPKPVLNVLEQPAVQATLLFAATVTLVTILVYVIGRIRAGMTEEEGGASELLTNFREMHAQGELSDEEFRTIKTRLTARLQQELKDAEETR